MLDTITVTKRSGRIEPLDISKIQKHTAAAVEGLEGVTQSVRNAQSKQRWLQIQARFYN